MLLYEDKLLESIKQGEEQANKIENDFVKYNEIISKVNFLKDRINAERFFEKVKHSHNRESFPELMRSTNVDFIDRFLESNDVISFALLIDQILLDNNWTTLPLSKLHHNESTFSEEEKYTLVHDFFKQLDSELFSLFCKIDRNNIYYKLGTKEDTHTGDCFYNPIANDNYITLIKETSSADILVMVHECAHAIANLSSSDKAIYTIFDTTREIESLTIETIAFDYFKNLLKTKDIDILKYNNFFVISDLAQYYSYQLLLSNYYFENGLESKRRTYKNFCDELSINPKKFKSILKENLSENIYYIIGKIFAIELRDLYISDKERFLQVYKTFLTLDISLDQYQEIRKAVPTFRGTEKYFYECFNGLTESIGEENVKKFTFKN